MTTKRATAAVTAVLLLSLFGLAGCGGDSDSSAASTTTTSSPPTSTETTGPGTGSPETSGTTATTAAPSGTTTTTEPTTERVVRAYFLRDGAVGPVGRPATGPAVAAAAVRGLLGGPSETERQLGFSSAVPAGTELLGVAIDDGVATVDLSSEFTSGGGSASMIGRVAQLVFTLTQFSTVHSVRFAVEGEPLTVLGGEGLLLEEPQTRADYEDEAPAILVESPLPFDEVESPLRIWGSANTFEAMFRINVVDGEGLIVYDRPAMATSGTGTRGTFDVTARFDVVREGIGEVIVFTESPKDGSQRDVVGIPVRISR